MTNKEICGKVGICEKTWYTWQKNPIFWEKVVEKCRENRLKHIPDIDRAIVKKAKKGKYNQALLWYRLAGEDTDHVTVRHEGEVRLSLETREKLRELANMEAEKE